MPTIHASMEDNINFIKQQISQLDHNLYLVDNPKDSTLYLKGFYDATRQFMQTFDKLLDLQISDKH